jgi:CheY-like chemotaxis protein
VRLRSVVGGSTTFTVWISLNLPTQIGTDATSSRALPRLGAHQLADDASRWLVPTDAPPVGVQESMLGPRCAGAPVHGHGGRVLVADDNADMRDYLARTLGAHWEVHLAADGEQALATARRIRPDLILADVMMPGLDGFALLRADVALKATPVVLVTARTGEDAAIKGLLAGADDYVAKPFSSRELVARIGAQLEVARVRRRGERQVRELLALMPAGMYACDGEGRFSYWNRAAVELWGAEPAPDDHHWALRGAPPPCA